MAGPFDDDDDTITQTAPCANTTAQMLFLTLPSDAPAERLDKALARLTPKEAALSRSRLAKMIAQGDVLADGVAVTSPKAQLAPGTNLCLRLLPAQDTQTLAEEIALDVHYEDDDIIVINKPVGMVVHPAPGTPQGTLVNALLWHCANTLSGIGGERRPGIVHRIDKDTSGLLVAAKSDAAHHGLAEQFTHHDVTRRYLAVVHGVPSAASARLRGLRGVSFEEGGIMRVATHLARHRTDRQRQAVVWNEGRHAITRVRVLENYHDHVSLVECWLETGRTHQIRAHMSYIGHGLLGDGTYGGRQKVSEKILSASIAEQAKTFPRQALHAHTLGFNHPITHQRLDFAVDPPLDMAMLIEALRRSLSVPSGP